MTTSFIVQLEDRPGALGRLASALGERGVNITAIMGFAEEGDGEVMIETSDPKATREVFADQGLAFEENDPGAGLDPRAGLDRRTTPASSRTS